MMLATKAALAAPGQGGKAGLDDVSDARFDRCAPCMRGYMRRNLFRMGQFFEPHQGRKKVSPLVTQLPRTKRRWPKRELERQICTGAVFRSGLAAPKVSPPVRQTDRAELVDIKDAHGLELLSLYAQLASEDET